MCPLSEVGLLIKSILLGSARFIDDEKLWWTEGSTNIMCFTNHKGDLLFQTARSPEFVKGEKWGSHAAGLKLKTFGPVIQQLILSL